MGRDKVLIEEFLRGYNEHFETTFRVTELPDNLERQKQAIDALAHDASGRALAIEHTLIQPFVGEKEDAQRLLTAIAPLEKDYSLRVPQVSIDVSVRVGAIPKGVDWKAVAATVLASFRDNRLSLGPASAEHPVPGLGFELKLHISKMDSPFPEGRVFVMRSSMPEDFPSVVRKALEDKVPKLTAARADLRILLFEMDNTPRSPLEITGAIEDLKGDFSELDMINECWCALTPAWQSEKAFVARRVWPPSDTEWPRFTVRCEASLGQV